MNKEKLEKIGFGIMGILVVVFCVYNFIMNPFEHIEDRNGANNTNIAVITNSEIIEDEMPSKGMGRSKTDFEIGGWQLGGIKFSSKKFSGVEALLGTDILFSTGMYLNIYNLEVNEGNFRLYVLLDDKIIDVLEPQEDSTYYLGDIKGYLTVVAVGESADFQFEMTHTEYNEYYHFSFEGSTLD